MGGSTTLRDYNFATYATASATMKAAPSAAAAFSRGMHPDMDPSKFTVRECRNSAKNPKATPIAIFSDFTGSMGEIARKLASEGLGVLAKEIVLRNPVSDPQLGFGGIGDVDWDEAPLQFGQFEVEAEVMMKQISQLYCEGNGGGNRWESYNLPWHLAAFHMEADCWADNRKGFLFTLGDETVPPDLTADRLKKVYGSRQEPVVTNKELLDLLRPKFEVFHLIIAQGNHVRNYGIDGVLPGWQDLMGQRAVVVDDYTKLGQIITSLIQVSAGEDVATVTKSWSDTATASSVSRALSTLTPGSVSVRPTNPVAVSRL